MGQGQPARHLKEDFRLGPLVVGLGNALSWIVMRCGRDFLRIRSLRKILVQ